IVFSTQISREGSGLGGSCLCIVVLRNGGYENELVMSLRKARTSLWLQWIILLTLSFSTCFSGLILYAQYWSCDPLKSGQIQNSDQILPLYVVEKLGHIPGISGLFVSGIFSGSLSTVSSSLNSLSAVTLQDYLLVRDISSGAGF
ncbi:hypothetical protein Anas_10627, partial [Armadillidium nasatum]